MTRILREQEKGESQNGKERAPQKGSAGDFYKRFLSWPQLTTY